MLVRHVLLRRLRVVVRWGIQRECGVNRDWRRRGRLHVLLMLVLVLVLMLVVGHGVLVWMVKRYGLRGV